ncbi:MAG: transposase, partial [Gammaproteobacteria bacterium]
MNTVWNWANETSAKAARPFTGQPKFLSGFDLNNLSAGASEYFAHIGADTIQRVNCEYALKRRQFKRVKLRWRVSRGARRALGWVQAKRLHRRAANRRRDALHQFSRRIVDQYQNIIVGDVSSTKLAQTRMAKAVLDAGWGLLKT